MGRQNHHEKQQNHGNGRKSRPNRRKKLMAYCSCPCQVVSSMFRGIGRCMFVTCYPVVQCTGLDDYRHRHHHHHHCRHHHRKHFNW